VFSLFGLLIATTLLFGVVVVSLFVLILMTTFR
jgi:hypothetical protein